MAVGRALGRAAQQPSHVRRVRAIREREGADPNFLQTEILDRLPARFTLVARIADDGDPTDDPTVAWPDGEAVLHESHDCIVWSSGEPIVVSGVQDLIVVHANGRILVMPAERAAAMKQLLDVLPPHIRDVES